jgi:hypothetical protein
MSIQTASNHAPLVRAVLAVTAPPGSAGSRSAAQAVLHLCPARLPRRSAVRWPAACPSTGSTAQVKLTYADISRMQLDPDGDIRGAGATFSAEAVDGDVLCKPVGWSDPTAPSRYTSTTFRLTIADDSLWVIDSVNRTQPSLPIFYITPPSYLPTFTYT